MTRQNVLIVISAAVFFAIVGLLVQLVWPHVQKVTAQKQLTSAVSEDRVSRAKQLLDSGLSPNVRDGDTGWTPLMEATAKGSLDMVVLLVGKGADVNARDTTTGDTPLSIASGGRNNLIHGSPVVAQSLPIVCYLLAHHAAVDAPDTEGITPLMVAANRGETDVVHVLIENKASVNLRDNSGQTALMKAVLTNFVVPPQRRVQTVEELIVGGTDVRLRDIKGRNAAAIAIQDGLSEIVPLLAR